MSCVPCPFLSGDAYGKGEKIQSSRFASDPGSNSASLAESVGAQLKLLEENKVPTLYRCRKCRRLVASESNVIVHSSGAEEPLFKSKRRCGGRGRDADDYGEPKCSSIFVEPMQWMTAGALLTSPLKWKFRQQFVWGLGNYSVERASFLLL